MTPLFNIEFLPIVLVAAGGIVISFRMGAKWLSWFIGLSVICISALDLLAEIHCERSLKNVSVRFAKGSEICPDPEGTLPRSPGPTSSREQDIARAWVIVNEPVPGGSGKVSAVKTLASHGEVLRGLDLSCQRMGSRYDSSRRMYPCETLTVLPGFDLSRTPGLDMSSANLEGIEAISLDLSRQNLAMTNLRNSRISRADFSEANLWGADFSNSDVSQSLFSNSKLQLAKFIGANFSSTNFGGSDMSSFNANGGSGTQASFQRAILRDANFEDADLSYSSFFGADLSKTNFRRANLYRASLHSANLSGADFTDARVIGADGAETDFTNAWAWNSAPAGLGRYARSITICLFDRNVHDVRYRPDDC